MIATASVVSVRPSSVRYHRLEIQNTKGKIQMDKNTKRPEHIKCIQVFFI
jgi:hypothetical protein